MKDLMIACWMAGHLAVLTEHCLVEMMVVS